MSEAIRSPSFPDGIGPLRSEQEVRAMKYLTITDVITRGADRGGRELARSCPFCGEDPPLAVRRLGQFLVGCENEDCLVRPQASGLTVSAAWRRWNTRAEARAK